MSTSKKVIHLSDDIHALVKEHCLKMGVPLKDWAEKALLSVIEREDPSRKRQVFSYVQKKPLTSIPEKEKKDDDIKPWELPPFWERTGKFHSEEDPLPEEMQV